eukprot:TRINITY_DN75331_c0_g1_i1.p1 TRINITY_DN75331_c0_g1~~TRINITY_DN75331_c0_g1_i1.p1  ORF type:complete len:326 (+),score=69.98 TRINITY_DN75331_c0_g1_i1:85-1062(+)
MAKHMENIEARIKQKGIEAKQHAFQHMKVADDCRMSYAGIDAQLSGAFDTLRWAIFGHRQKELGRSLANAFSWAKKEIVIRPADVADDVRDMFMREKDLFGCRALKLGFHGSSARNYKSIFASGLLIPGHGNDVQVANGQAHGRGVYASCLDSAWLSAGFCDEPLILICGIVTCPDVRQVKNAWVVGRSSLIIPFFEAYPCDYIDKRHFQSISDYEVACRQQEQMRKEEEEKRRREKEQHEEERKTEERREQEEERRRREDEQRKKRMNKKADELQDIAAAAGRRREHAAEVDAAKAAAATVVTNSRKASKTNNFKHILAKRSGK